MLFCLQILSSNSIAPVLRSTEDVKYFYLQRIRVNTLNIEQREKSISFLSRPLYIREQISYGEMVGGHSDNNGFDRLKPKLFSMGH